MESRTITFDDVLTFIRNSATADDLDRFRSTALARTRTLNTQRAASLSVGQDVQLDRYRDKSLNGLTGKVEHIERHPRKATYVAVRLDPASTDRYKNFHRVPEGVKEHVLTRLHSDGCFPA